jgi:methyl-accepting chemotaxis protein
MTSSPFAYFSRKTAENSSALSDHVTRSLMVGLIAAINRSQALIEFQMDGTILTANNNFLAIVGYTLEEIVGKHHSIFVAPAYRDSADYRTFWEKLGRGEYERAQYKRIGKGGKEAWLEASYNPILDAHGRPIRVMKLATDITAQKQKDLINNALINSLDAVTAQIIATDKDYNIIFVNKAAAELMLNAQSEIRKSLPDFDAGKLLGSNIDVFHKHPGHQRAKLDELKGPMRAQVVLGARTLSLTGSPMHDEAGARLGTVMEWVDRTEALHTEQELEQVVGAVIAGDLRARIDLSGKAGFFASLSQKINALIESFSTVVGDIQIAATEVARGVKEISRGNVALSERTEAQASSLEETAAAMEEMTASVRQNADNSEQANQLALAARDQAEKGGAVVSNAVTAMSEINQSSKKIADIIGVIDEIAFQTNLLALNAAVEAARAGDQGRGFAVVASEVRSLAGRSATAAKEIKSLIRDSVHKVQDGSLLVAQSGQTLEEIVTSVKKVSDIIAEIASGSLQQAAGIEEVNKAVMQLDEMTQQNAALVEEATAASGSIADQSQALSDTMSRYQVTSLNSITPPAGTEPTFPSKANAAERRTATRPWTKAAPKAAPTSPTAPARSKVKLAAANIDESWKQL